MLSKIFSYYQKGIDPIRSKFLRLIGRDLINQPVDVMDHIHNYVLKTVNVMTNCEITYQVSPEGLLVKLDNIFLNDVFLITSGPSYESWIREISISDPKLLSKIDDYLLKARAIKCPDLVNVLLLPFHFTGLMLLIIILITFILLSAYYIIHNNIAYYSNHLMKWLT